MTYTAEVIRCSDLLGLPRPFDILSLKTAYRGAINESHPDRIGGDEQRAKEVNAANAHLTAWLHAKKTNVPWTEESGPTGSGNQPSTPEPHEGLIVEREGHKVVDKRGDGGALWSGVRVPENTNLPQGWQRAAKRNGEVWTKTLGDVDALISALLDSLDPADLAWAPLWEDCRQQGGGLWSGRPVDLEATLPAGWARANTGGHAGQAWTIQPGDAETLVGALLAFLKH